jgi:hypothetical protein
MSKKPSSSAAAASSSSSSAPRARERQIEGRTRFIPPQMDLRRLRETDLLSSEDREHVSNFSITMSTNLVVPGDEMPEEDKNMMRDLQEHIFRHHIGDILEFRYDDKTLDTDTPIEQLITREFPPLTTFTVEVGTTKHGGRLHSHAAMKVFHLRRLNINIKLLKDLANEFLESHGYDQRIRYVHITGRGPTAEDYVVMGGAVTSYADDYVPPYNSDTKYT